MECLFALFLSLFSDLQDPKPYTVSDFGKSWVEVTVCNPQDQKTHDDKKLPREEIIISFPAFYFGRNLYPRGLEPSLIPPPKNTERHYYFQSLNDDGSLLGKPEEVSQGRFYEQASFILARGVNDSSKLEYPHLNDSYRDFVRALLKYQMISKEELSAVAKSYLSMTWIESVYCLDDVVPDTLAKEKWIELSSADIQPYLRTLARIKAGDFSPKTLGEITAWLDTINGRGLVDLAKAYAELVRIGCALSPESQKRLFALFDVQAFCPLKVYAAELKDFYSTWRLPLPSNEIIESVFCARLKKEIDNGEFRVGTLTIFREMDLAFPKDISALCRDFLLKNFGELNDIDFCVQKACEDAQPKLWKKYANDAFNWHFQKENRKGEDGGDYYHMAVEGYRRAIKLGGSPPDEQTIKKLLGEMNDLSAHMRDLIVAHEFAGHDPKFKYYLEKLEQRAERYDKQETGAFYAYGIIVEWRKDEYGRQLIPFRDAVELAAYLNDKERILQLSRRIANGVVKRVAENKRDELNGPAFAELDAIYELYRELDFKIGARLLAHCLHESGFILPARKFFHLGGIGKEAEEQCYGKHDDAYWEELQKKYNKMISKTPLK